MMRYYANDAQGEQQTRIAPTAVFDRFLPVIMIIATHDDLGLYYYYIIVIMICE